MTQERDIAAREFGAKAFYPIAIHGHFMPLAVGLHCAQHDPLGTVHKSG